VTPATPTAVILAAGRGRRLWPLTRTAPKCMTEVAGRPLLAWQLDAIAQAGFRRVVIVTGYLGTQVMTCAQRHAEGLTVEAVDCPEFDRTGNIVSLWRAGRAAEGPVLLVESDLIFARDALVDLPGGDRLAVERLPEETGSSAQLGPGGPRPPVVDLFVGDEPRPPEASYKTVNITSFTPATWRLVTGRLDARVAAGQLQGYYEVAIQDVVRAGAAVFEAVDFADRPWVEIDTPADLERARAHFEGPDAAATSPR